MEKNDIETSLVVSDCGSIARFFLPDRWVEIPQVKSEWAECSYSRDFSPVDDPSATMSLFSRGLPVSEDSAAKFKTLLAEMPHQLSADEINSISQVLSTLADEDAFELRGAQTVEISGRRALIVDGEWKKSQTQFHGLMIEEDESSRQIQEIFFEATLAGFMKYLNDVVNSIRSIEWKRL